MRDGAGILPYAAAPSDNGYTVDATTGGIKIKSWIDFVLSSYGVGVKPLFVGDLKTLYSFKLPFGGSNTDANGVAGAPNNECSGNLECFEAARRHTLELLHLRGGACSSTHSKAQSCYPLHGEGDTEGREIGSRADPYSVASISAAPPSAVGEIERIYMEVLRDNPKDIAVSLSIRSFCCIIRCFAMSKVPAIALH